MEDMRMTRASHDTHAQMLMALQALQAIFLRRPLEMEPSGLR
jgi:hypothetical protein